MALTIVLSLICILSVVLFTVLSCLTFTIQNQYYDAENQLFEVQSQITQVKDEIAQLKKPKLSIVKKKK